MKRIVYTSWFVVFVFTLTAIGLEVHAQGIPPGPPAGPTQSPIDGGLGFVLAAGGLYATQKLRKGRKKKG